MNTQQGLIFASILNQNSVRETLTWDDIDRWSSQDGALWIHLDRMGTDSQYWLQNKSNLTPIIADALLEEETRP